MRHHRTLAHRFTPLLFAASFVLSACMKPTNISSGNEDIPSHSDILEGTSSQSDSRPSYISPNSRYDQAERTIASVMDAATRADSSALAAKKRLVPKKEDGEISTEQREETPSKSASLTGEFLFQDYYDGINEAFIKMCAEPFSEAFGTLESLVQSGYSTLDIFGKYCFVAENRAPLRITLFEENENLLMIDYWNNYHMVLSKEEGKEYCMSFYLEGDKIWMNYDTPHSDLTYFRASAPWHEEIDLLIESPKFAECGLSTEPLRIIRDRYIVDGKILPFAVNYEADKEDHLLLPALKEGYLSSSNIANMFMRIHYDYPCFGSPRYTFEIEEGVLKGGDFDGNLLVGSLPEGIASIEALSSKPLPAFLYALEIPGTCESISPDVLKKIKEYLFVRGTERLEGLEAQVAEANPDLKILYADEYMDLYGILVPSASRAIEEVPEESSSPEATEDIEVSDSTEEISETSNEAEAPQE